MKAYKGFDKDLKCRGFQYEIGGEYKEDKAVTCECGFYSCLNPLAVLNYYPPIDSRGNFNRYCIVDIPDDSTPDSDKVATKSIKIVSEISLSDLIEEGTSYILSQANTEDNKVATNTGYRSAATNTGNYSAATNTGYRSAATNTGNYSAAINTGDYSAAANIGDCTAAINTGYHSAAINTGDWSVATSTGNWSAATNIGDYSAAASTGDCSVATTIGNYSAAIVKVKNSIAAAVGFKSKAKGGLGCWLVLAERNDNYEIPDVKTAKVDGEIIKADTYYKLINDEFVECE